MGKRLEDIWTMKIKEKLEKELDSKKYSVLCLEKIPYSLKIESNGKEVVAKSRRFQVDLVVEEIRNDILIPRLIIESKYKSVTTHDIVTYSDKAKMHKELYTGLRYGLMIGNNKEKNIPPRAIRLGENFDFMFSFLEDEPKEEEWKLFVDLVKRNLEYANIIEELEKSNKKYICIEKEISVK